MTDLITLQAQIVKGITGGADLIPIYRQLFKGQLTETVHARELHAFLESETEFYHWIKRRIKKYKFVQGQDYDIIEPLEIESCTNFNRQKRRLKNDQLERAKAMHKKAIKEKHSKAKEKRGAKGVEYILTINTAKELAMIENNEQGRLARHYFIKCEEALKALLPQVQAQIAEEWAQAREEVKDPFKSLCDALKRCYERRGWKPQAFNYSNEIKMINAIVLNASAVTGRKLTGNIKDEMTADELAQVRYLSQADEVLLDDNVTDYQTRKQRLEKLFVRKYGATIDHTQEHIKALREALNGGAYA